MNLSFPPMLALPAVLRSPWAVLTRAASPSPRTHPDEPAGDAGTQDDGDGFAPTQPAVLHCEAAAPRAPLR